jgi:hypothetical protein
VVGDHRLFARRALGHRLAGSEAPIDNEEEKDADHQNQSAHRHEALGAERNQCIGEAGAGHGSHRAADSQDDKEALSLLRRVHVGGVAPKLRNGR